MFGRAGHEHQGQQAEDDGLDEADEEFEAKEDHADGRHQEGDDEQQDLAGEDIAQKTEGERNHAGYFSDQFQDADRPVNTLNRVLGYHRRGDIPGQELLQVAEPEITEADHLDHDHGHQGQGQGEIEVCGRGAEESDDGPIGVLRVAAFAIVRRFEKAIIFIAIGFDEERTVQEIALVGVIGLLVNMVKFFFRQVFTSSFCFFLGQHFFQVG